jgi:hypothetical protein
LFKIVQDIERVACRTQRLPHAGPSQLTFVTCHDAGPTASMPPFFLAEGHHIKVTVRVQKQVEAALILRINSWLDRVFLGIQDLRSRRKSGALVFRMTWQGTTAVVESLPCKNIVGRCRCPWSSNIGSANLPRVGESLRNPTLSPLPAADTGRGRHGR